MSILHKVTNPSALAARLNEEGSIGWWDVEVLDLNGATVTMSRGDETRTESLEDVTLYIADDSLEIYG